MTLTNTPLPTVESQRPPPDSLDLLGQPREVGGDIRAVIGGHSGSTLARAVINCSTLGEPETPSAVE